LAKEAGVDVGKSGRRLRKVLGIEDRSLIIFGEEVQQIVLGKKSEFHEESFERFTPLLLHAVDAPQILSGHFASRE